MEITKKNDVSTDYLLEIKNLKVHFPLETSFMGKTIQSLKAVDTVDLHVKKGETLGIVGESGSGKSTIANSILQLIELTDGKIMFAGKNLAALNKKEMQKVRLDIQMIFQDPFSSLNPRMRVFDIIAEPLRTHNRVKGKELTETVYELIETVGLDRSISMRYPHEFSGGQRQRIGIARAIALKPKLVICDEPVSALDVSIQAQILNLLVELQEKFNLTFVFIGHGIPSVKYVSDRIAVMYRGEIVETTTTEKLFNETKHPYTQGLIAAVPVPDPNLRKKEDDVLIENDIPDQSRLPKGCRFYSRCPFGTEKCKNEKPFLREIKDDHLVACHYPLK
ncbi:ABC transporter ATP-binding protein [Virgibacillus oceani]